jgi:hypothetical protein
MATPAMTSHGQDARVNFREGVRRFFHQARGCPRMMSLFRRGRQESLGLPVNPKVGWVLEKAWEKTFDRAVLEVDTKQG